MKAVSIVSVLFLVTGAQNSLKETCPNDNPLLIRQKNCYVARLNEDNRNVQLLLCDPLVLTIVSDSSGGKWYGIKSPVATLSEKKILQMKNSAFENCIMLTLIQCSKLQHSMHNADVVSF
ncbi:hypothetical protein JW935_19745 [candidate division KSB1 bacterium]|nr:hypothetical protein [candidate division KSB1 bacterium]